MLLCDREAAAKCAILLNLSLIQAKKYAQFSKLILLDFHKNYNASLAIHTAG